MTKKTQRGAGQEPAQVTNQEEEEQPEEARPLTEAEETEQRLFSAWQETQAAIEEQGARCNRAHAELTAFQEQAQAEDGEAEDWRNEYEALRKQITSVQVLLETNPRQAAREGVTAEELATLEARKADLGARLSAWEENAFDREKERVDQHQALADQITADETTLADLQLKLETLGEAYRQAKHAVGLEVLAGLETEFARLDQEEADNDAENQRIRWARLDLQRSVKDQLDRYPELQGEASRLGPPRSPHLAEELLTAWLDWWNTLAYLRETPALAEALAPQEQGYPLLPLIHINEQQLRLLLYRAPGNPTQLATQREEMVQQRRNTVLDLLDYWERRAGVVYRSEATTRELAIQRNLLAARTIAGAL